MHFRSTASPSFPTCRPRSLVAAVLACSAIAWGVTGCGDGGSETAASGTGAGIQVESCGRTVTLDAPAEKIVVIGAATTDTLVDIGAGDRISGVVSASARPLPANQHLFEDLPDLGDYYPSREALLAHGPDLVIAEQGHVVSGQSGSPTISELEKAGIAVYVGTTGCGTIDGTYATDLTAVFDDIERIGTLVGEEAAAATLVGRLEQRMTDVGDKVRGATPVKVVMMSLIGSDLYVSSGGMTADILDGAGAVNLVDNDQETLVYSKEQIAELDPEAFIFFPSISESEARRYLRDNFPTTGAVKNDRLFVINPDLAGTTGPRQVQAVEDFARFLHPDRFA